ncbi:hypothetical protein UPYG_G00102090 [Umbra pygmaea]|uniref:Tetraspanin n=1 Tax=Umbra pygmaea TaxID=75934 RepID=A0ABD0X4X4_UMBPY
MAESLMKMGCFGFLKGMMFVFNGIIFLAGAAILGVGIWVKVDNNSLFGFLKNFNIGSLGLSQILNVGYLLIVVGAVLLILGFLGCCGAIKESRCMLMLFFVIVLILFIAEVAGAVIILVFKPLANQVITDIGTEAVKSIKFLYGQNADVTGTWNATMEELKCCGFYNYTDFTGSLFQHNTTIYPWQCCPSVSSSCNSTSAAQVPGCYDKFQSLINQSIVGIAAVALGIAALEVCAMVVSMTLYCRIDSKNE